MLDFEAKTDVTVPLSKLVLSNELVGRGFLNGGCTESDLCSPGVTAFLSFMTSSVIEIAGSLR